MRKLSHFLKRCRQVFGSPEPGVETAKFTKKETKIYNEVLAMHKALMTEINMLDSGDEAIHRFALFMQDLDMLGSSRSRRECNYVYQNCYFQYAQGLVGLIVQHWDIRKTEKNRRV